MDSKFWNFVPEIVWQVLFVHFLEITSIKSGMNLKRSKVKNFARNLKCKITFSKKKFYQLHLTLVSNQRIQFNWTCMCQFLIKILNWDMCRHQWDEHWDIMGLWQYSWLWEIFAHWQKISIDERSVRKMVFITFKLGWLGYQHVLSCKHGMFLFGLHILNFFSEWKNTHWSSGSSN